jgi:hypothetical protein
MTMISRILASLALGMATLALSGCFITPGKFASQLELLGEDRFTFVYEGEIFFLGLSDLAQMQARANGASGEDAQCFDYDSGETRECTEAERVEQRAASEAKQAEEARQMAMIMGGIDPSDPEATAELIALLLRQEGWQRVEAKGGGVFDVRFAIEGALTHDFLFPMIEGFATTNPFVQLHLRDDNVVRINAPGFSPEGQGNPFGALMGAMGGSGGFASMAAASDASKDGGPDMPNFPAIEGTFTIVTNGRILANNTDEGATREGESERLVWDVSPRTTAAPTALIDLTS